MHVKYVKNRGGLATGDIVDERKALSLKLGEVRKEIYLRKDVDPS